MIIICRFAGGATADAYRVVHDVAVVGTSRSGEWIMKQRLKQQDQRMESL